MIYFRVEGQDLISLVKDSCSLNSWFTFTVLDGIIVEGTQLLSADVEVGVTNLSSFIEEPIQFLASLVLLCTMTQLMEYLRLSLQVPTILKQMWHL